jgi:molybdate transport system regulatory protein
MSAQARPKRESLSKPAQANVQFRLRVLSGDDIAVGPGKIDLLEAIQSSGSISAAARKRGMSYRRAWLLIDTMNRCFREPVVEAIVGGTRGGGARLTPAGERIVHHYRRAQSLAARSAATDIEAIEALLTRRVGRARPRG